MRSGVGAVALLPTNSKLKELAARYMPPGALADGLCALGAGAANVAVINISPTLAPILVLTLALALALTLTLNR